MTDEEPPREKPAIWDATFSAEKEKKPTNRTTLESFSLIEQNMELHRKIGELEKRLEKLDPDNEAPEILRARGVLVRELVKLVPKAVADARGGKPALLRLIVRTIRLR